LFLRQKNKIENKIVRTLKNRVYIVKKSIATAKKRLLYFWIEKFWNSIIDRNF